MNSELGKKIGSRINSLLAEQNKKQKELSKHLGVTDNTISYFCKGTRMPNTEQIISVAQFFNVSTDYLLGMSPVATTDKDVQFICEYTGLDELSIKELHKLSRVGSNEIAEFTRKTSAFISERRIQDAKTDLEFINYFVSSPFNAVFNHRNSYLYEFRCNIEKFMRIYNQIIDFEVEDIYDSTFLFEKWNKFDDDITQIMKKIRVSKFLITDDFSSVIDDFANEEIFEMNGKQEVIRDKLQFMLYEIEKRIYNDDKKSGETDVDNTQTQE